jgi:chromosome segregation protein
VFLKSLTLKGFKSFADTTVLDFEPGVTVVVGPNGSGKSNVVDAIAWVLGAQGPRTVRSQKMDDVVFAGTAERPALGRAEVSLVIDNSAGLLPVEFNEVTITRTLYRSGDSEYALNGVPCRLLDVQELLSDAGVGRQQHIIVAQGQIDQVLNARPEDRRIIVEEAAGILKYRRRKERAERRLNATEANLTRLQDLQREVRRQLRPLEKQAEAARRHGDLLVELRQLKLHLAGRQLQSLEQAHAAASVRRAELSEEDVHLRASIGELDVSIAALEAQLAASGDAGLETLPRVESLRERCRGLAALVNERMRAVQRDRGSLLADDVVATLEAEHARIEHELADLIRQADQLGPEADELTEAEGELQRDQAAFSAERTTAEPGGGASGRAAEVRGELGALRSAVQRGGAEEDRLSARIGSLVQLLEDGSARLSELQNGITEATEAEAGLVASLDAAEVEVAAVEVEVDAADGVVRDKREELQSWRARAEALRLAIDDARSRSGLEELRDVAGVMGLLAELVEIEPGWENAVEAAAGEAMASVVVADVDAARTALQRLRDTDAAGAVLALRSARHPVTPSLLGEPVRNHVSARRPDLEPLLDVLLGRAICVEGGWAAAVDAALNDPDLVVVTAEGDRCGPTGWRLGAGGPGATAAALEEAEVTLVEVERALTAARSEHEAAVARRSAAAGRRREAAAELEANDDVLTRAADALDRVQRDRRDAETELSTLRARLTELDLALGRDRARVAHLEEMLPALEAEETAERVAAQDAARRREALDQRALAVSALRAELGVRAATLEERREMLQARRDEIGRQLADHESERRHAAERRSHIEAVIVALERLQGLLTQRGEMIEAELTRLRLRRQQLSESVRLVTDQLELRRRERSESEKRVTEVRELLNRADIEAAERRLKIETLVEAVRHELDTEPEVAIATEAPLLPEGVTAAARVRELEAELRRMGPINPLALEEYQALHERHEFVAGQLEDVKQGRRELNKVIRAIDDEIVRVFSAAFTDVAENFEHLFSTLFPGGTGRLRLTEPDDLLNTGVELEARPSGKNVRKLSLLSGGERSLTALAFLFAIFRSRPSPFYVMDEVEAALDDVNLHRFLELVAEFRREAQLVIVSHQKRTMEAADVLYGVSMPPGGASRVVSEKVA